MPDGSATTPPLESITSFIPNQESGPDREIIPIGFRPQLLEVGNFETTKLMSTIDIGKGNDEAFERVRQARLDIRGRVGNLFVALSHADASFIPGGERGANAVLQLGTALKTLGTDPKNEGAYLLFERHRDMYTPTLRHLKHAVGSGLTNNELINVGLLAENRGPYLGL